MVDLWAWTVINVIVPLSPLLIVAAALKFNQLTLSFAALLGDGFLYFYSVVIASGLMSDSLKDLRAATHRMPTNFSFGLVLGIVILMGATLLGYFMAVVRVKAPATKVPPSSGLWSLFFGVLTLMLSYSMRMRYSLW